MPQRAGRTLHRSAPLLETWKRKSKNEAPNRKSRKLKDKKRID